MRDWRSGAAWRPKRRREVVSARKRQGTYMERRDISIYQVRIAPKVPPTAHYLSLECLLLVLLLLERNLLFALWLESEEEEDLLLDLWWCELEEEEDVGRSATVESELCPVAAAAD
jgi:hypothetical protein